MNEQQQKLGGRITLVDPRDYTDAQKNFAQQLMSTWVVYASQTGVEATTGNNVLIGPFNVFLLHPEISEKLSAFQAAEAQYTAIPKRVRQVAILVTGGIWSAVYELYAQRASAQQLGFSKQAIEDLIKGEVPEELSHEEQVAARLTKELLVTHRVSAETYEQAEHVFGAKGLYDLNALIGVYQTVCAALNLFEVPVPDVAGTQQ